MINYDKIQFVAKLSEETHEFREWIIDSIVPWLKLFSFLFEIILIAW